MRQGNKRCLSIGKLKKWLHSKELSWELTEIIYQWPNGPQQCEDYFQVLLSDLPYFPLRCSED